MKETRYNWIPVLLDILGLLLAIGLVIRFSLKGTAIDDAKVLSIVLTFFGYYFVSNVIAKYAFYKHEASLGNETKKIIHYISLLAEKIESDNTFIEDFNRWKPEIREQYIYHLKELAPFNKNKFNSMFSGIFNISSDIFYIYWEKLLKQDNVKFYYSSAIVNNTDYFIANNIDDLKKEYNSIADASTKVVIHFILNNHKDMSEESKKSLEESFNDLNDLIADNPNVELHKGYTSNFPANNKHEWKVDFGIAGNIACAEMSQNYNEEKYTLYFNQQKCQSLRKIFNYQKKYLEKQ